MLFTPAQQVYIKTFIYKSEKLEKKKGSRNSDDTYH